MYEQQDLKLVGSRIKAVRISRGMSQADLAVEASVSLPLISNIERGKTGMQLETFVKVAEALQVSADYLLRPDVPEVKAIYQGEFAELLEDCSASEMETILKIVREVKASMHKKQNKGEHEAIVSRDDYIAVQHMINNAKYGGKSILPELRVIESGVLKGFVTISPKWAGFKAADYLQASMSVYTDDTYYGQPAEGDATFEVAAGDFDLRGFEVTNSSLFDANKRPYVLFQSKQIKFSTDCVRQFGKDNKVELLIHPGLRKLAVRRASKDSRQCVQWSRPDDGKYYAKEIPCTAFGGTLFELLDWETDFKFRAYGRLLQNEGDSVFIFDLSEPEIFIQSYLMTGTDSPISGDGELSPLSVSGKRVRAVPKKLADRFGSDFYSHRLTSSSPELQSEDAWKLWLEGQLFETGEKLQVTKFDEMQRFIAEQLAPIKQKEEVDFNA